MKDVETAVRNGRKTVLLKRRAILIDYMVMKTEAEDFHAVADASMDLREVDAELRVLNEYR